MSSCVKRIGVLGGMGPLATQLFYGMVISNTVAEKDQDHIDMIILNCASMPDRTQALLSGDTQSLYLRLLDECYFLENSGVSHIVIPCNTAHFFVERLQSQLKTPVINMIYEVVKDLKKINERAGERDEERMKVGILATDGTVKLGVYQAELEKNGFLPVILSDENQKRVMKIIYDGIKNGGEIDFKDFEEIEKEMKTKGCTYVIMGCTELSCFMEMYNISQGFYIDAMKTLAVRTIEAAGKSIISLLP